MTTMPGNKGLVSLQRPCSGLESELHNLPLRLSIVFYAGHVNTHGMFVRSFTSEGRISYRHVHFK